jgi:signal-transduction protein with cAMP-binding, CBS, and nucleotidyltransferase domain
MEVKTMNEQSSSALARQGGSDPAALGPGDPVELLVLLPTAWTAPQARIADLARQLADEHVGAVLVMEGDIVAGVISERDLVRVLASDDDARDVWVADVMSTDPVQVDAITPIGTAALTMLDNGVRHLTVTSESRVIGVVSMRDVLRVLTDQWLRS